MDDSQYAQHCREALADFRRDFVTRTEHLPVNDPLRDLAAAFSALSEPGSDLYVDGPTLVSRLFVTFPDFAPTFPRELLWFFAGECLHYMPDEEIILFQELDELRAEATAQGKVLNLREAKANLRKLQ